jgi:hypothetical protein
LGLFTEVRDVGDTSLLVLVLRDAPPRAALRLAVVAPGVGRALQLVVLDEGVPASETQAMPRTQWTPPESLLMNPREMVEQRQAARQRCMLADESEAKKKRREKAETTSKAAKLLVRIALTSSFLKDEEVPLAVRKRVAQDIHGMAAAGTHLKVNPAGGAEAQLPSPQFQPSLSHQELLSVCRMGFTAAPLAAVASKSLVSPRLGLAVAPTGQAAEARRRDAGQNACWAPGNPAADPPADASAPEAPGGPTAHGGGYPAVDGGGTTRPAATCLIHRETRKLPSGQPVVLSLVREILPDRSVRFRVLMFHPMTSREMKLVLVNPLLDKILQKSGLGDSRTATAEEVDEARPQVAALILGCVYVHPDGAELEFREVQAPETARRITMPATIN